MQSSTKRSLDSLTREDILRVCEKYRENKPELRRILRAVFKRRENIHLFGWFISKEYIELETPDFHREILREASDEKNSRMAFCAPRGHAKSTTVNFTYALWATVHDRVRFGLMISDTVTQSVEFVNALRDEIESNVRLRWLYGDLAGTIIWRDGDIKTSSGVRWTAKGAGMKIRGIRDGSARPDLIIFDDLENDEQVATAYQRKKLKDWFRKAALPALSRKGRVIMIGTVLHYDSLLQNILDRKEGFRSWKTLLYSAIMTKNGEEYALWPEHMDLSELKALRDDPNHPKYVGSIVFAQEYQNKPMSEDDLIVKPENIMWAETVPVGTVWRKTVLAVDPAVSKRDTADPTGKVLASLDQFGNVWVRYVGNERRSIQENGDDIRRLCERFNPEFVGVEDGALGLVFRDLLAGLPLRGLKAGSDKVSRLVAVSRFFEAGRVYFLNSANKIQELHDQLMEFPNGAHDDMVDALVYAIRMLLIDGTTQAKVSDFVMDGGFEDDMV